MSRTPHPQSKTKTRTPRKRELSDFDVHLFKEGNHFKLYEKLGAHIMTHDGVDGTSFAVWAPNADRVSVIGNFNGWNRESHPLHVRWDGSGIWECFVPAVGKGEIYKFHLWSKHNRYSVEKGDPFAFHWETPPKTGAIVWDLGYEWNDGDWMAKRHAHNSLDGPMSVYEVHLGSWRRVPEDNNRPLSYRELADQLPQYVADMGYTHVELLPVTEHPFYGSWGYQTVGYFAPTSRYGTPQDFMNLIDRFHQHGIGVILDWVPSHFPADEHGLVYFDGTHLFEHLDVRQGFHPDWNSYIFNYGRNEVKGFLISSALFWLDQYHIDGLRVDAVASMLYLDYSRREGEWIPNKHGGRENLDAINFLRQFNHAVYSTHPDVQTIAEESTAWPMVSRPTYLGGLGFGLKWNMGWMHDTLKFFSTDPLFRKYHHNQLTFSIWYAFHENFVLSISHDEVVHGKGSLFGKMPGDEWQKHANLRALIGYMYAHPGKKLLFMGSEFGVWKEWDHETSLEWHILQYPFHSGIQRWVKDLNHLYRSEPTLFELDFSNEGFEWLDFHDWENSIVSFLRRGKDPKAFVVAVLNLTPVPRQNYRIGVPTGGFWKEILNSDATLYGGSGAGNLGGLEAAPTPAHGRYESLSVTLPPLSLVLFKNTQKAS
ncbi:MAG: 1,4-alpha-glucan branching protein GlgB [Ignavibacteria bacterium]|nr:1,4-alpha-glucan branching protein GlgB [Ignavibacteria bacterium]